MIEKLTPEQEALLPVYRDKWIAIGLCTDPTNKKLAESGIKKSYEIANFKMPKVVWCGSPLSSGLARSIILNFKKLSVWDSVWASVGASVGASVWDSVGASVWDSVRASVWDGGYGQHDASWLGFYDYFNNVLKLESQTERLAGLWMIAQSAGWFIPHEKICWISERHDVCKLKNGRIHCDGGPAIHYPDGFSVWALNGVRVPEIVAVTSAEKIDPTIILSEKNAEVRREIVRKIGIERICQKLNTYPIDVGTDYNGKLCELLGMDMHGEVYKFVKLINPSVLGIYHIEGVPPDCQTVEDALNSRKPDGLKRIPVDDKNGVDWYEQGDVCVWPKNAKSIKSKPLILT